ncbi:tetratricopeptide repeat protein [Terribacillus sp. 7520-G]|nr:tetratricopeptide repeat protein [Terribacillus sp. 7520-G]
MGLVLSVDDKVFGELLHDFYNVMKLERENEAAILAETIDAMKNASESEEERITADLLHIRYQVMRNEVRTAEELLEQFEARRHSLSRQNAYFYHYFKGQILFKKKKWKEAIRYYEYAENYMTEEEEKADFYYKLANAYYQTYIPALSALHTTKALSFAAVHKQQLHLAKCKLLLGLNHMEIRNFEQAERNLREVLDCQPAPHETSLDLTSMVHHNLGLLCFVQHLFDEAVNHFEKAVHSDPCTHYMKSLYYLTESCFRANRIQDAMHYYHLGFAKSKEEGDVHYQWAFAMLHKQFVDRDSFEAVWTQGIDYFEATGEKDSVQYYSLRMAEYYMLKGEEEKANHYYRLAIQ